MPAGDLLAEARLVLCLDHSEPSEEEIQAAFKKLAIKLHPDRNLGAVEEATARFAEISAARDLLLDPGAARGLSSSGPAAPSRAELSAEAAHRALRSCIPAPRQGPAAPATKTPR